MSDFLQAVSDHLNRTPSMCGCGHPSVLHADGIGCLASPDNDGVLCPCEREYDLDTGAWTALCVCGHEAMRHRQADGCTARWEHDSGSDVCPCLHDAGGPRETGLEG